MTRDEAEAILTRAGEGPDDGFPLFEAALACAVHDDPERDTGPVIALAQQAVEQLIERMQTESPEEAVAETLAGDLHLTGDLITYDHPDNADIIAIAQRRKGLPVALGVFYLHAARMAVVDLHGVDFPGHFLLRIETEEGPLALDPFGEGRVVLPSELSRRALRTGLMPDVVAKLNGQLGMEIIGSSPDELATHMKSEIARWADLVKKSGATAS